MSLACGAEHSLVATDDSQVGPTTCVKRGHPSCLLVCLAAGVLASNNTFWCSGLLFSTLPECTVNWAAVEIIWQVQVQVPQVQQGGLSRPVTVPTSSVQVVWAPADGHTCPSPLCPSQIFSWGWGRYGNLGDNDCQDRHLPTRVLGMEGQHVARVECGWRHSAVVTREGRVFTFGWSKYGQLGHGDFT